MRDWSSVGDHVQQGVYAKIVKQVIDAAPISEDTDPTYDSKPSINPSYNSDSNQYATS